MLCFCSKWVDFLVALVSLAPSGSHVEQCLAPEVTQTPAGHECLLCVLTWGRSQPPLGLEFLPPHHTEQH